MTDHRDGEIAKQIMCMGRVSEAIGRDGFGTRSLYLQGFPYCVEEKEPFFKTTRAFFTNPNLCKMRTALYLYTLYHNLLSLKYSRLYSSALKPVDIASSRNIIRSRSGVCLMHYRSRSMRMILQCAAGSTCTQFRMSSTLHGFHSCFVEFMKKTCIYEYYF